jgi:acetyl esterase
MTDSAALDPALFRPDAIGAETAAANARLEIMLAGIGPIHAHQPEEIRAAREEGRGIWGPIVRSSMAVERTIDGPAGPLGLRVFLPDRIDGVYLQIHGGGFVLGRAHHSDQRNETIARACHLAVVSVDYRLAPEDPYPAGPDDCEAAAVWLARNARAEFGSDRLLIGGESAGANLVVATLVRLRDHHAFQGFVGANLAYGWFDLSDTPSVRRWGERELILSAPTMTWFSDHYVAAGLRRDPDVSPLYADLRGLPRALFTAGTLDPLLDDSLFTYTRWIAAGNAAELAVYPGGVHGFTSMPIALARRAEEQIERFLAHSVAESAPAVYE